MPDDKPASNLDELFKKYPNLKRVSKYWYVKYLIAFPILILITAEIFNLATQTR